MTATAIVTPMPYFLRATVDGADFEPEDGGQPFLRVGAPDLGKVRSGEVVVLDAAVYDEILTYVWRSRDALMEEGIGDRGGEIPPTVLAQAADHVGADVCARWGLGMVTDAEHGEKCSCWAARSWRGEDPTPARTAVAEEADRRRAKREADAEEARHAQERAEGRRVPWEQATPDAAPAGHSWTMNYRPVTDGSEHPLDHVMNAAEGRTERWRPYGEALLVPHPGIPAGLGDWVATPLTATTEEN